METPVAWVWCSFGFDTSTLTFSLWHFQMGKRPNEEMFLSNPSLFDRKNTPTGFLTKCYFSLLPAEQKKSLISTASEQLVRSQRRMNVIKPLHIKTKLYAWIEVTVHVITAEIYLSENKSHSVSLYIKGQFFFYFGGIAMVLEIIIEYESYNDFIKLTIYLNLTAGPVKSLIVYLMDLAPNFGSRSMNFNIFGQQQPDNSSKSHHRSQFSLNLSNLFTSTKFEASGSQRLNFAEFNWL